MGFWIHFIPSGPLHGLQRGIELEAQAIKAFMWAIEARNEPAVASLLLIGAQNVAELVNEAGVLLPNIIDYALQGHDPTAGSRKAFEDWLILYGPAMAAPAHLLVPVVASPATPTGLPHIGTN